MTNESNASGKSKKNYLNPIKDPRDIWDVHYNKHFGLKFIWPLNVNTVFHIPTKSAITKYGKDNCWVCIQKGVSEAKEEYLDENLEPIVESGKQPFGKYRYEVSETSVIRYDDFEKAKGLIPNLNQSPKPTNWN